MGRLRKPDTEKLVTVTVCLPPLRYAQLARVARARDIALSAFIRHLLDGKKTDLSQAQTT